MPSAVIFDMDGVVYLGNTPIAGVVPAISHLQKAGIKTLFLTNNATLSRAAFSQKLRGMGIRCAPADIMNSAHGAGRYLAQITGKESRNHHGQVEKAAHPAALFSLIAKSHNAIPVFVIGESGLRSEVSSAGCWLLSEREAARAEFVIVGLDRHVTYAKFAAAHLALQRGAKFIAANKDPTLPLEDRAAPGSGSLVALLETATGRPADVVIGKPGTLLLNLLLAEHNLTPDEVLFVGDRPEIDMAMANSAGAKSVLVLTGVAKRKDVARLRGNLKPTYVLNSAAELPGLIEKEKI